MGRGQRFRQAVIWAAGVGFAISASAWVGSLWLVSWGSGNGGGVLLMRGEVIVCNNYPGFLPPGWNAAGLVWPPEFLGLPTWSADGPFWLLSINLCWPVAIMAALFGASVLFWKRNCASSEAAHCPTCNYDLTGIDGVCPECGSER
jgi:hypothetical protein